MVLPENPGFLKDENTELSDFESKVSGWRNVQSLAALRGGWVQHQFQPDDKASGHLFGVNFDTCSHTAASPPCFLSETTGIPWSFSRMQKWTLLIPSPQTCSVSSSLLMGACRFRREISTNKWFLHSLLCGFAVYTYALIASLPCNSLPQVSTPSLSQSTTQ